MEPTTLLVRWANFEIDALQAVGFDAAGHMRRNGFPVNREPGWGRMPWAPLAALWKAAEKHTRDTNLGLHAATLVSTDQPGFIAYAMLCAANLRETFGFLVDFQRLCVDGRIVSLDHRRQYDAICLHPMLQPPPSKYHPEFLFFLFVRAGRHILGPEFGPAALHLRRTVSASASEFTKAFGCPVYWDQAHDEMLIDTKWMLQPSPYSHPETMRTLRERATQFMRQYTAPDWTTRVEALIERMLPEGDASVTPVAKNLGLSPRTLQRRLAEEGKTFDDLRETARRARALQLVGQDQVAVASVADQLGFSGTRAFRRAFRRWTGTTPSEMSHAERRRKTPPKPRKRR